MGGALLGGRRVLDLGSGEGFGAAILAAVGAAEVVGVDIDGDSVEHARASYARAGLAYETGSALDLGRFEPGSFGAVIAFEMIEHVAEQERLLDEVARVLAPDGLLVVSTPDSERYSEAAGQVNEFHARELTLAEFSALLGSRFEHVALWGQRTIAGSLLPAVRPARAEGRRVLPGAGGREWALAANPSRCSAWRSPPTGLCRMPKPYRRWPT